MTRSRHVVPYGRVCPRRSGRSRGSSAKGQVERVFNTLVKRFTYPRIFGIKELMSCQEVFWPSGQVALTTACRHKSDTSKRTFPTGVSYVPMADREGRERHRDERYEYGRRACHDHRRRQARRHLDDNGVTLSQRQVLQDERCHARAL